jgi:hypothetical protein
MDFFLNLPRDTNEAGLFDSGGTLGLHPVEEMDLGATYHHFRTAVPQPGGLTTFGHELDVILKYRPWKPLYLDFVYAFFAPEEIFEQARGTDLEHFVYSTLWVRL